MSYTKNGSRFVECTSYMEESWTRNSFSIWHDPCSYKQAFTKGAGGFKMRGIAAQSFNHIKKLKESNEH